jgi:putative radical SAM enzyme (TIGR03279 family)
MKNGAEARAAGGIMDTRITGVEKGGPAHRAGIRAGDLLIDINGETVSDFIDMQYLSAGERAVVRIRRRERVLEVPVEKEAGQPLGLTLDRELYPAERRCVNRCVFCFVDQLPGGMRPSLRVKDDDWRYSLLFGNYVTLTNVGGDEMARIIARKVSPLYVSVHATEGEIRARMMGNPDAAGVMEKLRALAAGGVVFHCQVVLCPGLNDGPALDQTLADLYGLYPAARSVAVVPLGLTRFRDGLAVLRPVGAAEALRAVEQVEAFARGCLRRCGERFAYAADEMYQRAGLPWPTYAEGCPVPQMSNGVGLMADFIAGFRSAMRDMPGSPPVRRRVTVATGVSAAATLASLCAELAGRIPGLEIR